jgi:hypothetical protein
VMSVCCRSILVHLAMSLLSTFARTNGTTPSGGIKFTLAC